MKQSDRPLFSLAPVEMGAKGHETEILDRLRNDPQYLTAFKAAFADDKDPYTFINVKKALEAYVRSLHAMSSAYDKFIAGDSSALSPSAQQGMILFNSDKLKCASCHPAPSFTNVTITNNKDSVYFNTGLYNVHDSGTYPADDNGVRKMTNKPGDDGKFKVPTLRNISLTAPYTHDGSVNSLGEMIDIYIRGGRNINTGPNKGDGKSNANKDPRITGFSLSNDEKKHLIDFLVSLTDSTVLVNPAFQHPFPSNK